MIETILFAIIVAKLKGYNPFLLFKAWPIYPIIFFEFMYVFFQVAIFIGNYNFIKYSNLIEKPFLIFFLILILIYKQYFISIVGSISMIIGGILNKIVISANDGKMPVFPILSNLTGYVRPDLWAHNNDIHILGTSSSNLKFLSDIFDLGYSIMSIGDIFIRFFVFIVIFNTIKEINIRVSQ